MIDTEVRQALNALTNLLVGKRNVVLHYDNSNRLSRVVVEDVPVKQW